MEGFDVGGWVFTVPLILIVGLSLWAGIFIVLACSLFALKHGMSSEGEIDKSEYEMRPVHWVLAGMSFLLAGGITADFFFIED